MPESSMRVSICLVLIPLLGACSSSGDLRSSSVDGPGSGADGGLGEGGGDGGGGADPSEGGGATGQDGVAPGPLYAPVFVIGDRIDFGNAASEKAHAYNGGDPSTATAGKGGLDQTYRQPKLVVYGKDPNGNDEKLTFTLAVDPTKQNYLTAKLWGSDSEFGVLKLQGVDGIPQQLDNNNSNGKSNPPFVGRFHYATTALPLTMTQGRTSVTVTLFSTGYYYDSGADKAGNPTRPVYSAFTHVSPCFVPPATDPAGPSPSQTDYQPPTALGRSAAYALARGMRGDIFDINNRDGYWHPGGWLVDKTGGLVLPGTQGAPPEVIGLRLGDGPLTADRIAAMNNTASPRDTWRNAIGGSGLAKQTQALTVGTTAYLLSRFVNESGATEAGYDHSLDPALLGKVVGVYDGLTRMQGAGGGWDSGCLDASDPYRWQGVTSTPRAGGRWKGTSTRQDPGCVSFEGEAGIHIGRTMLRLLNDNPTAAAAFKAYLDQSFDADLSGTPMKRAFAYERMLAYSRGWMGFSLKALTSADYFDKSGTTAYQAMIFIQFAYSAQLALRQLQALYPNPDYPPIDPSTMRSIVRQVIGLDVPVFMNHAPPGVDWRTITKAGISETYGTLSSGYDGRYGGGVPVKVGAIVELAKFDTSLSATDRADFVQVARSTIAAFNNFLYPQHNIEWKPDGSFVDHYSFAQEDVISYRVPYGPNANGAGFNFNLQLDAVVPSGAIQSPLARRAFLLATARGTTPDVDNLAYYPELEASWLSIAGVDPGTVPKLPGEPGAPDFLWADVESGAVALAFQGERLFVNANYNRPTGDVNHFARIHLAGDLVDREATVRMPSDPATLQDDGNLSGDAKGAWIVRYGRYLVVLNRAAAPCTVTLPMGGGGALTLHAGGRLAMGSAAQVPAGDYEVFVMP